MQKVDVQPELLHWAMERSYRPPSSLGKRFPGLTKWLDGSARPTFRQLHDFAKATATPFGYFFLSTPPEEHLPIPDLRTVRERPLGRPSADFLETLSMMRQRQDWMCETLVEEGVEPLSFVASAKMTDDCRAVAARMRIATGLASGWAKEVTTWREAVSELRRVIEKAGVMAVINGVVGNNTHRPLRVSEFRGFALCDPYAPLIFVNGADAKSAQMFTLAHELAHIWLGEGGVSGFDGLSPEGSEVEVFCNRVAAEFLAPEEEVRRLWADRGDIFAVIARHFKVSPIVAARRALDLSLISKERFWAFFNDYSENERKSAAKKSGGDFYNTQHTRLGEYFTGAVVRAAREGRLLYRDAYQLTGLSGKAFDRYAKHLGFDLL